MKDLQKQLAALIENRLSGISFPETPRTLYDPIRYTLGNGGKRLRPYITLLAAGMNGGEPEEAVPAALAVEMLHNFTLIHDDIMDGAETRRGMPSVYKKWDTNTAILSGDALFSSAYEQLNFYGHSERYSKATYHAIIEKFLQATRIVCEGQALDMEFEANNEISVDEYLNMIGKKTAQMLSSALQMGGLVGGADPTQLDHLESLGKEAGIAFQIQDDLLDAVGTSGSTGKRVGGDIAEGKQTYLSILARQKGSKEQVSRLNCVLAKRDEEVTEEEIREIIQLYRQLNVVEETRDAINSFYDSARRHLNAFQDSPYKTNMDGFLSRLTQRDS